MLFTAALTLATLAAASPVTPRTGDLKGVVAGKKKLTFDNNGNFKVLSFSDFHFGERWGNGSWASWGPENDAKTQNAHASILDMEQPNYVVFNGDLMTGENVFADNATGYLDQVFAPTVARNIPFSCTHGNHDNANNIDHDTEIKYEQEHYSQLSYTRSDVGPKPRGNGNYWVPIYAHDLDWAPAAIMWFFDSRSFVSGTGNGPGPVPEGADKSWIDEQSVPGYIKQQAQLMQLSWGTVPPSLVFVHIPFQKATALADIPAPGNHDENGAVQGFLNDTYTGLDLPAFDELVQISGGTNRVMAVTSGHNHGESWCARSKDSKDMTICYNGHSGYGGYETEHSKVRNGRVFNLHLKDLKKNYPKVETWNSYEDKHIDDYVVLDKNYLQQYAKK